MSGDNPIGKVKLVFESEIVAAVGNKHVKLFEAAFVKDHFDPLTGSIFPFLMLSLDSLFSSSKPGLLSKFNQLPDFILITHAL